jgi:hypothetical protein
MHNSGASRRGNANLYLAVEDRLRCLKIESKEIIAIAARTTSQRKACRHPPDGRPRSGTQQTAAAVTPRNVTE